MRTGESSFKCRHSSFVMDASGRLGQLWCNAHSKPSREISIARIRACRVSLSPHPDRYIVQRNEGFIHVIRSILNGGETNVPLASAASAIESE